MVWYHMYNFGKGNGFVHIIIQSLLTLMSVHMVKHYLSSSGPLLTNGTHSVVSLVVVILCQYHCFIMHES